MDSDIIIQKLPPVWFIRLINNFRQSLSWLNKRLFPANVVLYEHFQYFWLLPCLRVAAELDIAGIVKDGPRSIDDIATITRSNKDNLERLIRALSSQGIFRLRKGWVTNTHLSKPLLDGKGSLRYMIMQHLGTLNWTVFNELSHSIRTGKDAFSKVYGTRIYDYLSRNKAESELFDRSMTNLSEMSIAPLINAYDFSQFQTLADIGGGEGWLLSSILFKNKRLGGILFDLPEGLANSGMILNKFGVSNRVKLITGDFFETAPAEADGYILKNIIHNWSDDDCCRILTTLGKILPENGKILVIEMVIEEDNRPSFGKLLDIQMMVFMTSGRERTALEYKRLIENSGLRISRIIPTISPLSIIEVIR